jgi:site-specific DNA recombinase|tara:strand:- start:1395 stop:1826 length:432 start_codon:yes stop_codon:yes gene_type:complete
MEKEDIQKLKKENESLKKEIERLRSIRDKQKQGMVQKASEGNVMSRAPFGYNINKGKLIPAQNSEEIREIFEEFLDNKISLRKLSEKHNLSVNGLKKVLRNFTYIGKIRFNGQIHNGNHQPILSPTTFNHVQNKLERLGIKKN